MPRSSTAGEECWGQVLMPAPLLVRTDQDRAREEQIVIYVGVGALDPQPVVLDLPEVEDVP